MPIKFRCQHCRQFLGIAKAKAGSLTDCPTCGREIRVPQLDGTLDPVPEKKLDLEDSQLASALGALASLETGEVDENPSGTPLASPAVATPGVKMIEPAPMPEPIDLEPPMPAEKVVSSPSPDHPTPAARPAVSPEQELADLAAKSPSAWKTKDWKYLFPKPVLLTIVLVSAAMFAGGFFTAKHLAPAPDTAANQEKETPSNSETQPPVVAKTAAPAFQGHITFKTEDGDSRPDEGARVIVIPEKRVGSAKLSMEGFRPGADAADVRVARASLQAIGGDLGLVDAQGHFEVSLANPGAYRILVISNHQSQEEVASVSAELKDLLTGYFWRSQQFEEQILGRVQHQFETIRYKGESVQEWNHSFNRI